MKYTIEEAMKKLGFDKKMQLIRLFNIAPSTMYRWRTDCNSEVPEKFNHLITENTRAANKDLKEPVINTPEKVNPPKITKDIRVKDREVIELKESVIEAKEEKKEEQKTIALIGNADEILKILSKMGGNK
jgi:hypothetical protein